MSSKCTSCNQHVFGEHSCVEIGRVTFSYSKIGDFDADVELSFTEHSPDPYYSDTETEYPIDANEAQKLIDFLQKSFSHGDTQDG